MKHTDFCPVVDNEPMARHCSWRAGGHARHYAEPENLAQLETLVRRHAPVEPLLWLGLGSNLLVRDGGFPGLVIATRKAMNTIERCADGSLYVGAGVSDAVLARYCQQHGLQGGEFLAGIPGLIGGALAMNAGAWGGETWGHVEAVEMMHRQGDIRRWPASAFEVGYRSVKGPLAENGECEPGWFVGAWMRFAPREAGAAVRDIKQLLAQRAATQPTGQASCGSVFRNPPGDHAARLIEACGLKGLRIGGAVVSQRHANFIINDRQATASDIENLIETVRAKVRAQTGVSLQPEVRIVGDKAETAT